MLKVKAEDVRFHLFENKPTWITADRWGFLPQRYVIEAVVTMQEYIPYHNGWDYIPVDIDGIIIEMYPPMILDHSFITMRLVSKEIFEEV